MKTNLTKHVEGLNIESGGTYRGACPVCRGSNTFTVFNDSGRFIYNCYKLACRIKGAVNIGLTAQEIQVQLRKRGKQDVVREEIPTMEIPQYVVQPTPEMKDFHGFLNKWKVPAYGLLYDVKDSRCVFPIYKKGRIIDAIGRSLKGDEIFLKSTLDMRKGHRAAVKAHVQAMVVLPFRAKIAGMTRLGRGYGHQLAGL